MKKHITLLGLVCLLGLVWACVAEAQRQPVSAEPEAPGKAGSGTGVSPVEPTGGVSLPRLIKFSAVLKNRMGQPRTGIVGVTFALYQDQQGGAPLWLEVQNLELDEQGRYTVLLGATQTGGLPLELFAAGRARWLGVQVQGEEESPEASGRILLVSVPYALKAADAETLGGKPASAFVLAEEQAKTTPQSGVPPGAAQSFTLTGPGVGKEQIVVSGTVNRIAKFTAADAVGNSLLFDNGVSIGLGTTTPNAGGSFTIAGNGLVLSGGAQDLMVPDTQDLQMGHINALGTVFTERLRLTAGGSVGIGTTTPLAKLQVNVANPFAGTIIGSSALSVGSVDIVTTDAQGTNVGPLLVLGGNRATTGTNLGVFGGIRGAKENSTDGNTAGYLGFYTLQAGVGFSERMRITSTGLVGMGTLSPNPGARLTLVGGLHMRGAVADVTVPDGENLQLGHLNFLGGLFTERLRITPTGNVGIGTTTPGQKLEVVGNVLASGSMSATSFAGSGAGLTSLNPTSLSAGTAAINITGNAATATTANNALALGSVPAASFARLDIGNSFTGDQSITGNLSATGSVSGATGSFSGSTADQILNITQSGSGVAVRGDATAVTGVTQGVVGTSASSTDYAAGVQGEATATSGLTFGVLGLAESTSGVGVVGRASATTGTPAGVVGMVVSATGTAGLFDNEGGGKILSGQVLGVEKFSVDGSGNVTASGSVTGASFAGSGTGLTSLDPASLSAGTAGISITGNAATATTANNALALGGVAAANFARLDIGNNFTGNQSITGSVNVSGAVQGSLLSLPNTAGASAGVITLGAERFAHNFGAYNTFVGGNAGNFTMSGSNNTASGAYALYSNTTGANNTASGTEALFFNTTGANNTASGATALLNNTTGHSNTASGVNALYSNTTGSANTATGLLALSSNTTGFNNTASGVGALHSNTSGYDNTASGRSALGFNTEGHSNTASGLQALLSNTTGFYNTASGAGALWSNTTGVYNSATGTNALYYNTTGSYNTALGFFAGVTGNTANANTTGSNNTFIGYQAGPGTATQLTNATAIGANAVVSASNALVLGDGTVNVGIGTAAPAQKLQVVGNVKLSGSANGLIFPDATTQTSAGVTLAAGDARYARLAAANSFTGDQGVTGNLSVSLGVGASALSLPNTASANSGVITFGGSRFVHNFGSGNTFVGLNAGNFTMTGSFNTASGVSALYSNASGSNNTAIGYEAGVTATPANANTTGSNNTFIGYQAGPGTATQLTNATAIGANALVSASNALVLGDGTVNVGIGTTAPGEKLSVAGIVQSTSGGFKFPDGTTQTTAAAGGDITAVTAGTGLAGGATSGDATLSLDTTYTDGRYSLLGHGHDVAQITNAATLGANSFSGDQSITGNLTASGWVNGNSFRVGDLTLSGTGLAGTDGTPSSITVKAGNAFSGVGSGITLTAGNGANARGGQVNVAAGITSSWSGAGVSSDVFIRGGEMEVNASYAQIQVGGGKAIQGGVNESHGGVLQLQGGNGVGTNRNGGHVVLLPGAATGTGTPGNVGIGTATPSEKLHIVSGNTEILAGGPGAQADLHGIDLRSSQPGHAPTLWLTHTGTGGRQYRIASWGDNVNPGALRIRDDTAGAERVTIDAGGNVGIGTTAPGQMLTVAGTIESTSGGFKFPDGTTQTTAAAGGDITAVNAGTGLSGGGTTGDVTLSLDTTFTDARYALLGAANSLSALNTFTATPAGAAVGQGSLFVNPATAAANTTLFGAGVAGTQVFRLDAEGDVTARAAFFGGAVSVALEGQGSSAGVTFGVKGNTSSTGGTGVRGDSTATTGQTFGVHGVNSSDGGIGVFGFNNNLAGTGTPMGVKGGVLGAGIGVFGQASNNSFATIGVKGEVSSSTGVAGVFDNKAITPGDILLGRSGAITLTTVFRVDGSGTVRANAYRDLAGNPIPASDLTCTGCVDALELNFDSATQVELDTEATVRATADASLQSGIDTRVLKAGDTMTGALTLSGNPTAALHAATKQYVDAQVSSGEQVVVLVDDFDSPTLGPTIWDTYTTGVASVTVSSSHAGLQTDGPNEARLTSDKQFPLSAGTLIFKAKISAYSEASTVYGDKQPRGLVAGSDRNNAIEFISSNGATLGCRTVSGGTVTETVVAIGQNVLDWAFYQIVATPTVVKFYFNGALIATHTTNIPTVPLNVYIGTSYTGGGNIPVSVEWVSFERRL